MEARCVGSKKRKKAIQVQSIVLETQLGAWVKKMQDKGVHLSRKLITAKARRLQTAIGGDASGLRLSTGWLAKFEQRHDLRLRFLYGEAASVDPKVVERGRRNLLDVLAFYDPDDIFNMDETGLYYSMEPSRSICGKRRRGKKRNKTRITSSYN